MTIKVKLDDVRVAYAQGLFEARAPQGGGEAKFNCAFLFAKDHPAVQLLADAIVKVAEEQWKGKAQEVLKQLKASDKLPVHDGDNKSSSAGYPGNLYVNAGNKLRPLIIDGQRQPLTQADGKPYSGCYVNGIVEIWAQDNQFGRRINASLLGVQFLRDGERLAGGSVASVSEFEAIPTTQGTGAGSNTVGSAADLFS